MDKICALLLLGIATAATVCLTACLEVRDDGEVDGGAEGCDYCHGTLGGAHAVHVDGTGSYEAQLDCTECHPVPTDWFVSGHLDAVVQIQFPAGSLATTTGLEPTWDGAVCDQVYCHGATMPGAQYPQPVWTQSFPDGLACEACHGNPPQPPHPAGLDCEECHEAAYTESEQLDPGLHVNGVVEFDDEGEDKGVGP